MLDLKKIAVTGAVASGKSSVCQIFKKLNAYIVDSDKLVHQLLDIHTHLGKQITELFGSEIVKNGQLSRQKIAEKAFRDPEKLKALEKLVHPPVLKAIEDQYEQVKSEKKYSSFVVEIPLLFEAQAEHFYDFVILVTAEPDISKKRLKESGLEETEYDRRMARQLATDVKSKKAHFVLQNNGSFQELEENVRKIDSQIQNT